MPVKRAPRQAAVIAVRRLHDEVEVCLIRRRDSTTWGIPKGFIDPGDSPEQAALNEAVEEAGLRGRVVGVMGLYDYDKRGALLTVALYLMEVTEELKAWREMRLRERRWFSLDEAGLRLTTHPVRPLWDCVRGRLEPGSFDTRSCSLQPAEAG